MAIGRKCRVVLLAGVIAGGLSPVFGASPAIAGGGCHDAEPVMRTGKVVDAKGNCFFPTVLFVNEGATVTWTNRDAVEHSVTGLGARWGDESLQQGDSVSVDFSKPGVYPYTCYFHPGMVGAVVVGQPTPDGAASASNANTAPVPSAGAETSPARATVEESSGISWRVLLAAALVLGTLVALGYQRIRARRLG